METQRETHLNQTVQPSTTTELVGSDSAGAEHKPNPLTDAVADPAVATATDITKTMP